jgi:hypothetical protein
LLAVRKARLPQLTARFGARIGKCAADIGRKEAAVR